MKGVTNEKFQETQHGQTKKFGWGVRHLQVACMCVCITALIVIRSSMGVAVLAMTDPRHRNHTEGITTYDWDKKTQGVILSSFFWGYTMLQIPSGILSKKFGGKPILLFALITNGIIYLLIPLSASVGGWQLVCACRLLAGVTQAATYPATHTLLGRWLPGQERVMLTGLVYAGTALGTIIGLPVSGFLAETSVGWPLVFYALGAVMLVIAALWYWLTASSPAQHRLMTEKERAYIEFNMNIAQESKPMKTPWRHILTSRPVWALMIAQIGQAYGYLLFFVDLPTYLEKGLGISLKSSSLLSALPYIGMWIGSMLASTICEKLHNRGLLSSTACRKLFNTIGSTGIAGGVLGLALGSQSSTLAIVWLVGGLTVCGFGMAGFMMNHLDLSPNLAGILLSLTNFVANLVNVPTPIVTSLILQNDSTNKDRWRTVFFVAAAVSLACNAVYVMCGSGELQPWDDPHFLEKDAHPEEMKPLDKEKRRKKTNSS